MLCFGWMVRLQKAKLNGRKFPHVQQTSKASLNVEVNDFISMINIVVELTMVLA